MLSCPILPSPGVASPKLSCPSVVSMFFVLSCPALDSLSTLHFLSCLSMARVRTRPVLCGLLLLHFPYLSCPLYVCGLLDFIFPPSSTKVSISWMSWNKCPGLLMFFRPHPSCPGRFRMFYTLSRPVPNWVLCAGLSSPRFTHTPCPVLGLLPVQS